MPVPTRTITGTILMPNAAPASGGRLTAELSYPATANDGTYDVRVAGRVTVPIGVSGDVSLTLVPNDVMTPAGTHYLLRYSVTSPLLFAWSERVTVPDGPGSILIGDLPRLDTPSRLGIRLNDLIDVDAPAPLDESVLRYDETAGLWTADRISEAFWRYRAMPSSIAAAGSPRWFTTVSSSHTGQANVAFQSDYAYGTLHVAPVPITIDRLALDVWFAATGFQKRAAMFVYSNRADGDPWPDRLLASSDLILVTSTGVKQFTLSPPVTLPIGGFWLVWGHDAIGENVGIRTIGLLNQNGASFLGYPSGITNTPGSYISHSVDFSGGGLVGPDPFPTATPAIGITAMPMLWFRPT